MGWGLGHDNKWQRYIGYEVPAYCDFPTCNEKIDRGLSYVCGSEPYGGEYGCGLYFCQEHFNYRKPHGADTDVQLCPRCYAYKSPYNPKPEHPEWIKWLLKDKSWETWRKENPEKVKELKTNLTASSKEI